MLYLIGLGLGGVKDITVKGLEAIKKCHSVYLDSYTSILPISKEEMEQFYGKPLIIADRNMVESDHNKITKEAISSHVAFLVVGDPLAATTHTDLILRARDNGTKVEIIHNASVLNAVSSCGLQLYRYGQTVSIPLFQKNWRPQSFLQKIEGNLSSGLHTLCLLDIRVKEQSWDNLMQGSMVYDEPRFMTIKEAISQILEVSQTKNVVAEDSLGIGVARLGQKDEMIRFGSLGELMKIDFGKPLHSLIVVGEMDEIEKEFTMSFKKDLKEN